MSLINVGNENVEEEKGQRNGKCSSLNLGESNIFVGSELAKRTQLGDDSK